ncbi:unnamed protein product [Polarella glacialis]|uniref:Rieske domain-containing protein n=1 Tax=Polarella glacialis TaxID=89957 RepID=A0A813GFK3_POLGL|nr:unnamed protein product [Polarella glacialis]
MTFVYDGRDSCVLYSPATGKWISFARSCPHAGIDLLSGDVEDLEDSGCGVIISCPAHAYLFDAHSGSCLWDTTRGQPPATPALLTYDVEDRHGG